MAIGWYIVPYKRRTNTIRPGRVAVVNDYTAQLAAVGGRWGCTEILGNRALVKVSAPAAALTQLDAIFRRIPKDRLDDSLADLPTAVKTALRDEVIDAGYTVDEVRARFGDDLSIYTLRDVLRFMASRRIETRYDKPTDEIVFDGQIRPCESVDSLDSEII